MTVPDAQPERRKREEAEFHDRLRSPQLAEDRRDYDRLTSNRRFYAIDRRGRQFLEDWVRARAPGSRVLDYGCGEGWLAVLAAVNGGHVTGIDISSVSIENSRRRAERDGLADRTDFVVMDAEDLQFPANSFRYACISGVLHHLDLRRAYSELARVIEPTGAVVALEALGHNPLIQLYRKLTPQLRTSWEADHIIRMPDIELARHYFRRVEVRFFHLATLLAVPFRSTPFFGAILGMFEAVDALLLRVPLVREQAWMVGLVLEDPIKPQDPTA